jgi:hypothetical protein
LETTNGRNLFKDAAVDNIKMDLTETGFEGEDWIHVAQDRNKCRAVDNTVTKDRVP